MRLARAGLVVVFAVATVAILGASTAGAQRAHRRRVTTPALHGGSPMFPQPGPIAGADPSVRHAETLRLPTRMLLRTAPSGLGLRWDPGSMHAVPVQVGARMVLGVAVHTTIWQGARQLAVHDTSSITGLDPATGELSTGDESFFTPPAAPGLRVRREVEVFETDIPPQHEWNPRGGQYRVVYSYVVEAPL